MRTDIRVVAGENGGAPQVHETPILTDEEKDSKIDEIILMINDSNAPLAPIKRLIAAEIAKASRVLLSLGDESANNFFEALKIKALEARVKALRELGKELTESDVLSKKDFLNFEGPKLGYVLNEYRQGASDSLKKIGIDEGTVQQFLRHWRDLMLEREAGIRRATEKLEFDSEKSK